MLRKPDHIDMQRARLHGGPQLPPNYEPEQTSETAYIVDQRRPVGFILVCTTVLCINVAATIYFSVSMSGEMDMPGGWTMSMMWMRMPDQTWIASGAMFLLMWQSMMVAMMLPSAFPMFLSYHGAQYRQDGISAGMSTLLVAIGYFFVWLLIGTLVYGAGMAFAMAAMRSSGLSRAVPQLSGIALVIAGGIQFTSWKMRELRRCRNLQHCTAMQTVGKNRTAWRIGLSEGISCAICTSGLMLILLTLGAMDLAVMAVVTVLVAMEKLMPKPDLIVRIAGFAAIGAGLLMIMRPLF